MKILLSHDGSIGHYYDRTGLTKAFLALGIEAKIWDINTKSAFDAFDELDPTIFISQTYNLNRDIIKCIEERPYLKVVLRCSDYSDDINDAAEEFPILKATDEEIKQVEILKEKTGKPDLFFSYNTPRALHWTTNGWNQFGPVISLMKAADPFLWSRGEVKEHYQSDFMYLGGLHDYKKQEIYESFLSICSDFRYNVKIFGNTNWPFAQYCGYAPESELRHISKSSSVCYHVPSKINYDNFYAVSDKIFNLAFNKCFIYTEYSKSISEVFGDSSPYYGPLDKHLAKTILNLRETNKKVDKYSSFVKENHTYLHRVEQLLKELGEKVCLTEKIQAVINQYY